MYFRTGSIFRGKKVKGLANCGSFRRRALCPFFFVQVDIFWWGPSSGPGQDHILIAVTEKDLAAIVKLGAARAATLVWRIAERADGLATRMQRAIEAMVAEYLGGIGGIGGIRERRGEREVCVSSCSLRPKKREGKYQHPIE